jgi:putative FmdB family regulatory protein
MPTYEYQCKDCGFRFEEFQSIADAPLTQCPSCSGQLVRLLSGGAGLIFRGSGFYITDYKNNKVKGDLDSEVKKTDSEGKTRKTDEKSSK